ncbi:aspartate/glutamate racemase family protein [Paenibacillus cymbidii]|uniref:aspartate/glutamate racemase family protein n=1 Tax=Paenibacillus cymbidii TaxID=1639034 RepID=UPI0010821B6C|nr:aspartate/glutamate racemase family protein [Paenibacillus cymbidii]
MSARKKLAILHTTPVTVDPLKRLAAELLPGCDVINFVDDSILPQLAANGGDIGAVEPRLVQYAKFAAEAGADVILNACSSVGELAAKEQAAVAVPVVRIDEAMAREAVRIGARIGVAATLPTTLAPTLKLLRETAAQAGKAAELVPLLAEEAYRLLIAGDAAGHDRTLAEALERLAADVDVVVLAQASMARVVDTLPAAQRGRFLSSPRLGMLSVKAVLDRT